VCGFGLSKRTPVLIFRIAIWTLRRAWDTMMLSRRPLIRDYAAWGHSLRIMVVNVVVLLIVCGCVPPARNATTTGTRNSHRQLTSPSDKSRDHELSDREEDRLFRDFERWRAAKGKIEQGDSPTAGAAQPIDSSAGAPKPIDTSPGGRDEPPNDWVMPY
jgi:hypothetical protein